jgi:integrase
VVQEIIDNGYDFDHPLFEQKLNDQIKDVARIAGIDQDILVTRNAGGKIVEKTYKKYERISSHTARRSFATNAYKAGIPTIAIMKVTGHKRESTFLRYIRISEKENTEMLKQSDFFKKPDC